MDGWIPTHTIGRLSCPVLFYVGSFSSTPHAASCGDILLHTLCWFMWGLSILCRDIITCPSCCFTWGVFLKFLMLFVLCGEFLWYTRCCFTWRVSLTHPLLFDVGRFSYMSHTILCGEFLWHHPYSFCLFVFSSSSSSFFFFSGKYLLDSPCCFMWGFSYITGVCFYTGSIFSMPYDIWYQEFLLHILCKFMWRHFQIVCTVFFRVKSFFDTPHAILCWTFLLQFDVNILVYLGSFSCTLYASSCGQFLLHVLCCFMSGVSLTHPELFPVGSFTDTVDAVLSGEFLLHASCCSILGISLTRQLLFYVGIFSYIALAALCGEFLLHPPCCSMWGLSLPSLMLFYVRSFSYMLHAVWCGEFLLHAPCCFMCGVSLTRTLLFYVSEKEAKSLQKRGNGKVCLVTARRGLHSELHTRSGLSVVIGMTWRAWACWRAAATDAPRLASSQYRLERLRADMTLSVRFDLTFGHKKLVLFCTFQCANIAWPGRTLGRCSSTWHHLTIGALIGIESLLHAQASFIGKFLPHVPYATCSGRFLLHVPC